MANKVKTVWLMILFLFTVISLSGCAVIGKEMSFWPDAEAKGWIKEEVIKDYYSRNFQAENLSFKVYPINFYEHAVSIGPPFLPFIPIFAKPDLLMIPQLQLKILTQSNLVTIDLSEVKLRFSPDTYFYPVSFHEATKSRPTPFPITGHTITLNKEERTVYVSFNAPYDEVESFVLEFGDIHIGDSKITLPPLEYNKKTKYRYFPFVFSH